MKMESNQITKEPVQVEVSRTRFYVLLLYCVFTMEQCANWNTYGPVASSAKVSFVSCKQRGQLWM